MISRSDHQIEFFAKPRDQLIDLINSWFFGRRLWCSRTGSAQLALGLLRLPRRAASHWLPHLGPMAMPEHYNESMPILYLNNLLYGQLPIVVRSRQETELPQVAESELALSAARRRVLRAGGVPYQEERLREGTCVGKSRWQLEVLCFV